MKKQYNEENLIKQYNKCINNLTILNESFTEKIVRLFTEKAVTVYRFEAWTLLNRGFYSKFKTEGYVPKLATLMSLAVGLELDLAATESLLDALSVKFQRTNKVHAAYIFLLTYHVGEDIRTCNRILNIIGITESDYLLGSVGNR